MRDDLVSALRAVSVHDPALDHERMPMDLYYETRDEALIVELPGQTARRFVMVALTSVESATCDSLTGEGAKFLQAFRLGCAAVENLHATGIAYEPTLRVERPDRTERLIWRDSEIDAIADEVGLEVVYEMGALALQRRHLGKWGRGDVRFTPPLFLVPALAQSRRLRAAHIARTAGTPSSDRSPKGSPETRPESSAGPSDVAAASGAASPAATG